jgi:AbrB family looped-hinge helix DNA binding protein
MVSRITSKGQLTIPKSIRTKLRLRKGDRVEFLMDSEGNLRLIPLKSSIKDLKGMVPAAKRIVTLEEMQKAIELEVVGK